MGWYKQGESLIAESIASTRIITDLYNGGVNYVPKVFLGDTEYYGVIKREDAVEIDIDRYYYVPRLLREKIRTDISFKESLWKITYDELKRFEEVTLSFENCVKNDTLSPKAFSASHDAHKRVLALVEFNSMLPIKWYNEILTSLSVEKTTGEEHMQNDFLKMDDFSFSQVIPHRIHLRLAKLRLLKQYFAKGKLLSEEDIKWFINNYSYLEIGFSDVEPYRTAARKKIMDMLDIMLKDYDEKRVRQEIKTILRNRKLSETRFYTKLNKAGQFMVQKGFSAEKRSNIISALTIISLAATEEEYRHILQERYYRTLGSVIRTLGLSFAFTTRDEIVKALKERPWISFEKI